MLPLISVGFEGSSFPVAPPAPFSWGSPRSGFPSQAGLGSGVNAFKIPPHS